MKVEILFIQEVNNELSGTIKINNDIIDFEAEENGLLFVVEGPDMDSKLLTQLIKAEIEASGYSVRKSSASDLLGAEL